MCKPASVRPSSHYVTGSEPFLEPKGEVGGGAGMLAGSGDGPGAEESFQQPLRTLGPCL